MICVLLYGMWLFYDMWAFVWNVGFCMVCGLVYMWSFLLYICFFYIWALVWSLCFCMLCGLIYDM